MKSRRKNRKPLMVLEEIKKLPFEEAREIIVEARENYSTKELKDNWNVSHYTLYEKVLKPYNALLQSTNGKYKNNVDDVDCNNKDYISYINNGSNWCEHHTHIDNKQDIQECENLNSKDIELIDIKECEKYSNEKNVITSSNKIKHSNLNLNISGIYKGRDIEKTLSIIKQFIDNSDSEFEVRLTIEEI